VGQGSRRALTIPRRFRATADEKRILCRTFPDFRLVLQLSASQRFSFSAFSLVRAHYSPNNWCSYSKARILLFISPVTHILEAVERGDAQAAAELLPLVYEELRRLAASKMANEAAGNTLQPTALVHEAWLRLVGNNNPKFAGRPHFFAAAAEAMRRILIDRARSKQAVRHGGGQQRLNIDQLDLASPDADDQVLAINDALEKLAAQDPIEAQLVKLKYFVGLTVEEAASMLDIAPRTARNYWAHARAWLAHEITVRSH